jgi:HEAT repeat protein
MRYFILATLLLSLAGCTKSAATLSGGKPVSHWVQALHDPDSKARKHAVSKLGNVGTADSAAFPALLEALKDRDPQVRCEVVTALLKFGPKSREAIPALTELQRSDRSPQVRQYASRALAQLQPTTVARAER